MVPKGCLLFKSQQYKRAGDSKNRVAVSCALNGKHDLDQCSLYTLQIASPLLLISQLFIFLLHLLKPK
jgi:hypothetical protein